MLYWSLYCQFYPSVLAGINREPRALGKSTIECALIALHAVPKGDSTGCRKVSAHCILVAPADRAVGMFLAGAPKRRGGIRCAFHALARGQSCSLPHFSWRRWSWGVS